jgi:oxygen tolerance protein BatD
MRYLAFMLLVAVLDIPPLAAQDTDTQDYFIKAVVDNPTPFVGQQITYHFMLYDAIGLNGPLYEPSDFEGFWRIDLADVAQRVEQLNGRQYSVSEIRTALFPTRTGDISIAPAGVLLPETDSQTKRELKSNVVAVQVLPLPEGAPEGFSGAVGQFEMTATLDRQSVKLGEPITLRLTVTGTGNVEQLSLPSFPIPSTWRMYENPTSYTALQKDDKVIGSKTFELLIFPDHVGSESLPAITLRYFDPSILAYRSVASAAMPVEVLPSDTKALTTPASSPAAPSVIPLKPILTVLEAPSGQFEVVLWILWLLPLLVVFAAWGWYSYRKRFVRDRMKNRQSQALQLAYKRMTAARKLPSEKACAQVKQAVLDYVADKLCLPSAQLNWEQEIDSPQISQQLQHCIDLANLGLYAPGSDLEVKSLIERVAKMLADVDLVWKSP